MTALFKSLLNNTHQLLSAHSHVKEKLSECLKLPYQETKDRAGNVCFLDSEEVRPEYRLAFTATDVTYYLLAVLSPTAEEALARDDFHLPFPFPDSPETFWKKAEAGRNLNLH
jgi:hypothetical protein